MSTMDEFAEMEAAVTAQGDKIRELKTGGGDKEAIAQAVEVLVSLKANLNDAVEKRVAEQAEKIRAMKESSAEKDLVDAEVQILLALKAKLPQPAKPQKEKKKQANNTAQPDSKKALAKAAKKEAARLKKLEYKKAQAASGAAPETAAADAPKAAPKAESSKSGFHVDIEGGGSLPELKGAKMGEVCTRFPPEPSGHLHIGHTKAIFLNWYYARRYNGTLRVRFDDTNPSNEKEEYEHAIIEDLKLLGVVPDKVSWTSDHFDLILEKAEYLIEQGLAYVDDTPLEKMREERFDGIASARRDSDVETVKNMWNEMKLGTEIGRTYCLRAKISVDDPNKAMRDPTIYRCNEASHARTKKKYNVYPTYDLACPIVDSVEGITHAMRDTQYSDREPQFEWFIKNLKLRPVEIQAFSRLNFNYTFLSKRKLGSLVEKGSIPSWNDPRFPTITGLLRRGLTVQSLRAFMLGQGASRRVVDMQWDKFWSSNRRVIDPIAPRYTAISEDSAVEMTLTNVTEIGSLVVPKHPKQTGDGKNGDLGMKAIFTGPTLLLEREDCNQMVEGEEVTLMRWGNAKVVSVSRDADGNATKVTAELNLEGDVKSTKLKVNWVAKTEHTVRVRLSEFDFLITKAKLEKDDNIDDFLNPVTEAHTFAIGSAGIRTCQPGDIIQLERRAFFRVDAAYDGSDKPVELFTIPDGKSKAMSTLSSQLAHR